MIAVLLMMPTISFSGIRFRGNRKGTITAHVRFLATSTSVHDGDGQWEDVYLAAVLPASSSGGFLVRLVDDYPSYRASLPREELTSGAVVALRLRRDPGCDRPYGEIPLRTAPGEPLAVFPARLGFQPALPNPVEPSQILPCYRTVRR